MLQTSCYHLTRSLILYSFGLKPDATVEEFRGGPGEFQQVLLPEATDKCSDHRISSDARCSADVWERRGEELGSCDSEVRIDLLSLLATFYPSAFPLDFLTNCT